MKKLLLILLCVLLFELFISIDILYSISKELKVKEEVKEEYFLDKDSIMEQFNKDLKLSIEFRKNGM